MATLNSEVNQDEKLSALLQRGDSVGVNRGNQDTDKQLSQQQRIVRLYQPTAALNTFLTPVSK